jgi:O-acetylhomoserine/O-acetylserine sulfhydrylase-like pyridoxal-dependent enzyme
LVRGGTHRSEFHETSEGLFLTSGYAYDSAEQAQRAFKGDEDVFMYSRYGNPTVAMFEERLALIEGAKHCFATASGMAAVYATLATLLSAGDRIVASRALFGSCHVSVLKLSSSTVLTLYNGKKRSANRPQPSFLNRPLIRRWKLLTLKRSQRWPITPALNW